MSKKPKGKAWSFRELGLAKHVRKFFGDDDFQDGSPGIPDDNIDRAFGKPDKEDNED